MYSISDYGSMIADRTRTDAYAQALRQAVKPGSVVLDIGTGTGIFALLACQLGASRVYAIEIDDIIQVAQEVATTNGYADRIEFIHDISTRVTLPRQADVIISDMHGVLPLCEGNLPSLIDARKRLLAAGGVMIPQRETLWMALVEAQELYSRFSSPWDDNPYGIDLGAVRSLTSNRWRKGRVQPEQLLVEPRCWATLDYASLENPDIKGEITWNVSRSGICHGFTVWFDTILIDGLGFSNAAGEPELIFGSAFFPWSRPTALVRGDAVSVAIQAKLVGEDYIWSWDSCVRSDSKDLKAEFKQSTFFGMPLSAGKLRKQATNHIPTLDEEGQIDRFILTCMDGRMSLRDIANAVSARYSSHFKNWQDALTRVGELSKRYSQ
jgi:ribosomal protein L11 methyltransferase PrmA/PRMT5 arginine-N-methyltransferase